MTALTFATITVRYAKIAYHFWPNAPAHRAYLRSLHRHTFKVEVECLVTHNDRQVEFHDLQDAAIQAWPATISNDAQMQKANNSLALMVGNVLGAMSCEMIATHIGDILRANAFNITRVSVSEEDDYTATVTWLTALWDEEGYPYGNTTTYTQ